MNVLRIYDTVCVCVCVFSVGVSGEVKGDREWKVAPMSLPLYYTHVACVGGKLMLEVMFYDGIKLTEDKSVHLLCAEYSGKQDRGYVLRVWKGWGSDTHSCAPQIVEHSANYVHGGGGTMVS